MYIDELFSGLDYDNFPQVSVIDNRKQVEEMVKVSGISVLSDCEHHSANITRWSFRQQVINDKIAYGKFNRPLLRCTPWAICMGRLLTPAALFLRH